MLLWRKFLYHFGFQFLFICIFNHKLLAQQQPSNASLPSPGIVAHQWDAASVDSNMQQTNRRFGIRQGVKIRLQDSKILSTARHASALAPAQRTGSFSRYPVTSERPNAVCYTISGRDFLRQDSLILFVGDASLTADGKVLVSGEFADYSKNPLEDGGFCMKTDISGNVIWAKLYDSTADVSFDYVNYFKSLELKDGSILLAGRTTNNISHNDDVILTKLDNNGNTIWIKTYECRFWQGFNGSGDFFNFREIKEDPLTGELYFVGSLWGGISVVTKVDAGDGHVIWSNAYDAWGSDHPFGIIFDAGSLILFQLEYGYYDSYVGARRIDKVNGDTLSSKHIMQGGTWDDPHMFNPYSVVKLNNGHYRMSGPTTRYYEFPAFTGTIDLYHAIVVELDNNFNFVKAFVLKNRVESNGYNTKVSLFPDGTGVFSMFDFNSPYTGESHISIFKDDRIYHQRKRIHINEGMPYEPPTLQLADGGYLNIKLMGDSTALASDGSKIDYYRMYSSDTASLCLGVKDSATSIRYIYYEPATRGLDSLHRNVFRESRVKNFDTWNFQTNQEPSCAVISHCDTLDLFVSKAIVCSGDSVIVTTRKNKACGSLVPLMYDSSFVDHVTQLTDSTCLFQFKKDGKISVKGSLMGCVLREDSVLIQVLPARFTLDLGPDTVLCRGNTIKLNTGGGFATYLWQDGSTDTAYTVTQPGRYHVLVSNGCGSIFKDTVDVKDHPAIPINIGPDRYKCNTDTIRLQATAGFMNYSWSPNYNISFVNGQTVVVNPSVDTIYSVVAEKTTGCFAYDTVRIDVRTSPKIDLGGDTSVCRADTILLDAGPGFSTYRWSDGSNGQFTSIHEPGIYFVKATTLQGCSSYDTLNLLGLYDLPQPNLGPDSIVCINQPRELATQGNYLSFQWSTGAVSNKIVVDQPGLYWLLVKDVHGCSGTDSMTITSIEPAPANFLSGDTSICSYGSVVLQSAGGFKKYLWSNGTSQQSITVNQPGKYWLEVVDDNSCKGRDSVIVSHKECMEGLYVPTAFTPNKDGRNDLFTPLLFGDVRLFRFRVYNRWGTIVFETTTPGKGWDGSLRGDKQDSNVFVWHCTYQLNGKKVEQKSGKVVLIR